MDPNEIIIELVRENKCLYDKSDRDVENSSVRRKAWIKISESLKTTHGSEWTGECIARRWTFLKDMYSCAQRNGKKLQSSGIDCTPEKQFVLCEKMDFLSPHICHRRPVCKPRPNVVRRPPSYRPNAMRNRIYANIDIESARRQSTYWRARREIERIFHNYRPSLTEMVNLQTDSDNDDDSWTEQRDCTVVARTRKMSTSASSLATLIASEDEQSCKRKRVSYSEIRDKLNTVTNLLTQMAQDSRQNVENAQMVKNTHMTAIGEALTHIPAEKRVASLIEILQVLQKYE